MSNTNNNSGGIGICGAMFIVFLVLKLTGTVGWSWWWITAPLWIPMGVVVASLLFLALVVIIFAGMKWPHNTRRVYRR